MAKRIRIIVKATVDDENIDKVIELYKEIIEETVKEEGCLQYELYQEKDNPNEIALFEEWASEEHLEKHTQTAHFKKIVPMLSKYETAYPAIFYKKLI